MITAGPEHAADSVERMWPAGGSDMPPADIAELMARPPMVPSFDEAIQACADAFVETRTPDAMKVERLKTIIREFGDGETKQAIGMLCLLVTMS